MPDTGVSADCNLARSGGVVQDSEDDTATGTVTVTINP